MHNHVKKYSALALVILSSAIHAQSVTSHSFFSMRPLFQSGSPELFTLFHDLLQKSLNCHPGAVQLTVFGGKSTKTHSCLNPLAQYFMPFGKTTLVAGEFGSQAALNGQTDISANYFGVLTANPIVGSEYAILSGTFESLVSFNPQQAIYGAGIVYKQQFWHNDDHAWWFSASTPLVHVNNRLGFTETIINAGSGDVQPGYVATIGQALEGAMVFGNKVFKFGKITCNDCPLTKTGFADIELKLGYVFADTAACTVQGYGGVVIPTSNKPKGEFIFEPIIGNNQHFGFIVGGESCVELFTANSCNSLQVAAAFDSRYLLSNTQCRSFDLIDKQWSRYIWLYPHAQATAITDIEPGINFLTQPLRVSPRFSVTVNMELLFNGSCSQGEIGMNLYARQAEKVCLKHGWQEGPGIVGILPTDRFVVATKRNASQPTYAAPSNFIDIDRDVDGLNPAFVPIKQENLNLSSAAHPAFITHTAYGAWSYRFNNPCHAAFIGCGGSYEFSADNTGINRWLVWGKGGVAF